MKTLRTIALASLVLTAQKALAIPYNFDVTFNGLTATQDASSDPIAGTNLLPGDTFNLDIHTLGNDFWQATAPTPLSLYATFLIQPNGTRVGNAVATFFLDGVQVAQDVNMAIAQSFVHLGADGFGLAAGFTFDQLVLAYSFTSTNAATVIQATPDIVAWSPFFRASTISYVQVPDVVSVPEPATALLVGAGLLALGLGRRRRQAASVVNG